MARNRDSKPRKMRPQFLVLCEGETEENYINLLRQNYRLPIKIVSRIVGDKITQNVVSRHQETISGPIGPSNTFAMYDGDKLEVVNNLEKCHCTLLISKPCIEVWFLSHFRKALQSQLTSHECLKQLKDIPNWHDYKKAYLSEKQGMQLWENRMLAVNNMGSKNPNSNVHSSIFKFIQRLEEEKAK